MKCKTAVRIEHPESGCGIFTHKSIDIPHELEKKYSYASKWGTFPLPWEEFGEGINLEERCAFSSWEQFHNTVPNEILRYYIEQQGYRVYVLKLKQPRKIGKHQVIFDPSKNVVEKKDITLFMGLDYEIKNSTFTVKI